MSYKIHSYRDREKFSQNGNSSELVSCVNKDTSNKNGITLTQASPDFYTSGYNFFDDTMGKGEIARNEQFLFFPECFLPFLQIF